MEATPDASELLRRWNDGDEEALAILLERSLPWLRFHVSRRMGGKLRRLADTQDYVHDVAIEALRLGPKFQVADEASFRALLARIVENTLLDRLRWQGAQKRDLRREERLASNSVVDLDPALRSPTRPSEAAQRGEARAWLALALELLDPDDRRVLQMRAIQELPFHEIAERLDIKTSAVQMRFVRALPKLRRKLEELQDGRAARALRDEGLEALHE